MTREHETTKPAAFDIRSWINRFESEAQRTVGDRIRIDFDLPDGPAEISADPRELDELFTNLVLNMNIAMQPCGRLTIHLEPDDFENLPDEDELTNPGSYLHLAIVDRGCYTVSTLFRRLLDPLINVAPQLANRTGALRWGGKILFEESETESGANVIHLLLPYAGVRDEGH